VGSAWQVLPGLLCAPGLHWPQVAAQLTRPLSELDILSEAMMRVALSLRKAHAGHAGEPDRPANQVHSAPSSSW
jgi:hypothetical protein